MQQRTLCAIGQERLGHLETPLERRRPALIAWRCRALRLVCSLKFVILRGRQEQLLDGRRPIVDRRVVDPDDAVVAVELKDWTQLEPRDTSRVDAHQVQPMARDLDGDLLPGPAIAATEERRLAA